MKTIFMAVIIGVVAVTLFINNPTEEQYFSWVKNKINFSDKKVEDIAKDKLGDVGSLVVSLLPEDMKKSANKLVAESSDTLLRQNTTRDNYYVCSIYKTDVNFAGYNFHAKVLGIMDNFVVFSMGSE